MVKGKRKRISLPIFVVVLVVILTGYLTNQNIKLHQEVDRLTNPYKATWQYFDDEEDLGRFLLQYPRGWSIDNVNKPKQYVFVSPGYTEDTTSGHLKVVRGGWISLRIDEINKRNLQELRDGIEKNSNIEEIKDVDFIDQDAIWYTETDEITGDHRVKLVTIKDGLEYSLLLVYNPIDPDTEKYYYVFNEMAQRLFLNK